MSKTPSFVDPKKAFIAELDSFGFSHNKWEVFRDFCEMFSLALRLPFEKGPKVGEQFGKVFSRYSKAEQLKLDGMTKLVVDGLEREYQDFLGSVFMLENFGNEARGQFFTPYCLCQTMAEMQLGDVEPIIKERKFFTVNDPCVGAGSMLIAVADTLRGKGLNPSTDVYFVAQDVDLLACQMAHIQLSLGGMGGEIIWGNTLTVECREVWRTPVYYVNGWTLRLALDDFRKMREARKVEKPAAPIAESAASEEPIAFEFSDAPENEEPGQMVFSF